MSFRIVVGGIVGVFAAPGLACAGDSHLQVPIWSVAPFVCMLLCIALLPLLAPHFWHSNFRRLMISCLFAAPIVAYMAVQGDAGLAALWHGIEEYIEFIALLGALYVIAGGILLEGNMRPTPFVNTAFLAVGAVLANLIGTTGASMLLIRPFLRINKDRKHRSHLPLFFIFCVSNMAGLLTPLGDPPLFLGFLRGVDFFWTMRLWPEWLIANGLILAVFFAWDFIASSRESAPTIVPENKTSYLRMRGNVNWLLLVGVVAAVLLKSDVAEFLSPYLGGYYPHFPGLSASAVMAGLAVASLAITPRGVRKENGFTWEAILEVAVLFIGIFITLVPATLLLSEHGDRLGLTQAWHYFWVTGSLSAFLDNAPTYLTIGTIRAHGGDFSVLMRPENESILQALSCGAVFFGALTYIGNGPNFMVKSIAERTGYTMPSFFGYFLYALVLLGPILVLTTILFFMPV